MKKKKERERKANGEWAKRVKWRRTTTGSLKLSNLALVELLVYHPSRIFCASFSSEDMSFFSPFWWSVAKMALVLGN